MARDYWMTRRLAPVVDKIRQTIELPAVTANCGPTQGSLYVTTDLFAAAYNTVLVSLSVTTGVTLDFYAKVMPGTTQKIMRLVDSVTGEGLELYALTDSSLRISVIHSGGTQNTTAAFNYLSEWHRFTITFDASGLTTKLYIDNVLVKTTAAIVGTVSFTNGARVLIGNSLTDSRVNGYFNEIRVWDELLSQDEINATTSYRSANDSTLEYYVRLRAVSNVPIVGTGVFASTSLSNAAASDDAPTILYGASFVVAEWPVELDNNVSLVWPQDPDDGTTGMLVVRWTDSDDVVQRRRLWNLDGVDIAPEPELYAGENVGDSFVLELWNIDGEETCVLPDDLTLHVSITTDPQTSYDHTAEEAADITVDTTLAATYPLTFPITFNTQQTY